MSERELLGLAAKAAGYPIHSDAKWVGAGGGKPSLYMGNDGPKWNPLTDDGDAFRLMAELSIDVAFDGESAVQAIYTDRSACYCVFEQSIQDDRAESVRRAIVNAAAEIGKTTP